MPYFYDVGTDHYKGVCHIALPEEGHTRPGEVLFGTDSHTCTAGAFGEFATGIGNTDAGFILGTGKLWVKVPPTMRFVFHGQLPPYLMAKDLILAVIGDIGCDGATYRAMEFDGDGVYALNIEERMTLCNMVIEAGGKNGVIAPDKVTLDYVNARNKHNKAYTPVYSDAGAKFLFEKVYDVTKLQPVVAKPHSPDNRAFVGEVRGDQARSRLHRLLHRRQADRLPRRGRGSSRTRRSRSTPSSCRRRARSPQALKTERIDGQTLEEVFLAAGAKIGQPSCAACLGGPSDTFGRLNSR